MNGLCISPEELLRLDDEALLLHLWYVLLQTVILPEEELEIFLKEMVSLFTSHRSDLGLRV